MCGQYSCGSGYNNFATEMECAVTCGSGQTQPAVQYPAQPAVQYPAQPAVQYPMQPGFPYPTPLSPSNSGSAFRPPYSAAPRPEVPPNGGSGSLWDSTEYVPLLTQEQFPAVIQNQQVSLGKSSSF